MVGYDPDCDRPLPQHGYAIAGAASGVMTRFVAQPLDVLKIRFQLQVEPINKCSNSKYRGMLQACSTIYKEEGICAFWKGHIPAQGLSLVYGLVQFASFELITKYVWIFLPSYLTTDMKHLTHFVCGSVSGCLATVAAQPFDVIRTRFVAQGEPKVYKSILDATNMILRNEGVLALYKGLVPTLIQIAPQTGLQFGFYSVFQSMWNAVFGSEDKSKFAPVKSLICGAWAGLGAKMAIYPLDMVKKRLQIQGFQSGRDQFGRTDTYYGLMHCVKTVNQNEGMLAFYKGLSPSLAKAAVSVSFHFLSYEWCCHLLQFYYHS